MTVMTADHGNEAPDELEVLEVVRVDEGGGVYLQTVVIFAGVFKQAVHRIQNLVGQQEEPLPAGRKREAQKLPVYSTTSPKI